MEPVRIAVIGTKGMGRGHIKAVKQLDCTRLTAVCDVVEDEARAAGQEAGVPHFTDVGKLLESGLAEAVTICTPHWYHPPIAVQCAAAKVHVLTEKPMAVTVAAADEMIEACRKAGVVLAVVYQQRFSPVRVKARGIIESGALGEIMRAEMIYTCCRTNFYYRSGDWRATWAGEGGGVLLNQAPHLLDQFAWQLGMMPKRLWGRIETVMHPIEVEDRASAMMEFPNGATGYFHVSTTETPPLCRIEIAGDRGRLRMDGDKLTVHLLEGSMREFVEASDQMWATPPAKPEEEVSLAVEGDWVQGHVAVIKDFAEAIRKGARPAVTGEEGRWSVELADAVILSSERGGPVELPLDRGDYDALIARLSGGRDPRSKALAAAGRARREEATRRVREAAQRVGEAVGEAVGKAARGAAGAAREAAKRLREAAGKLAERGREFAGRGVGVKKEAPAKKAAKAPRSAKPARAAKPKKASARKAAPKPGKRAGRKSK